MSARSFSRIVIFMSLIILLTTGFTPSNPTVPIEKKVAVIFIEHSADCSSDAVCNPNFSPFLRSKLGAPRFSASTYTYLMNQTMTRFITEATYNHTHMVFTAVSNPDRADGWFDAPHTLEEYNEELPDNPRDADIFVDASDLAFGVIGETIATYDMILVVRNFQWLYGYTPGCGYTPAGGYVTCPVKVGSITKKISIVSIGENIDTESMLEVLAHELGHVHRLFHVVMGQYDMVGNSDVLTHYGGWSKVSAGWVPEIVDLSGPGEVTAVLDPLARPGKNVVRIPYFDRGNIFGGYIVECRARIGFDQNIPEEGVIVTQVNTIGIPGYEDNHAIIQFPLYDNIDPDMNLWEYSDAALAPGESFVNKTRDLTVTHVSTDYFKRCTVTVKWDPADSPDPLINPYTALDNGLGYINNYSKDIWIDSQKNGWDVYPEGVTMTQEGGQSHPNTFGDPAWVNHENRIKYIIRNEGYGDAHNVFVDIYLTQPMRLYDFCNKKFELNDAKLIATQEIPLLEKDGMVYGSVPWTPTSNAAFEVTVVIKDYMGEITHDNNKASETYAAQNTLVQNIGATTSPVFTEMPGAFVGSLPINIGAALKCDGPFRYRFTRKVISAIDRKYWVMGDGLWEGVMNPGDDQAIPFSATLPQSAKPGDCEEVLIQMEIQRDDIFVPVDGFVYKSCVVAPSELTCKVPLASVESGKVITINGQLTPAGRSEKIVVEYTSPSSKHTIQLVSTINGAYSDSFTPNESGKWQLQAYWQGTDKSAPAESGICQFEVAGSKPEFTLNSNTNCRAGPGMDYPVYTAGKPGDVIPIFARSPDALWLYGTMKGFTCWVKLEFGKLNINPLLMQIRQPPPLTVTITPTTSVCSNYTSESGCYRLKDQCKWVVQPTGTGSCVPR